MAPDAYNGHATNGGLAKRYARAEDLERIEAKVEQIREESLDFRHKLVGWPQDPHDAGGQIGVLRAQIQALSESMLRLPSQMRSIIEEDRQSRIVSRVVASHRWLWGVLGGAVGVAFGASFFALLSKAVH